MNYKKLILLILICNILSALAGDNDYPISENIFQKNTEIDSNGDGKPDIWKSYKDGEVIRAVFDSNFDGNPDTFISYQGNEKIWEEDSNNDGAIDLKSITYHDVDASGKWNVKRIIHKEKKGDKFVVYKEAEFIPQKNKTKITTFKNGIVDKVEYVGPLF